MSYHEEAPNNSHAYQKLVDELVASAAQNDKRLREMLAEVTQRLESMTAERDRIINEHGHRNRHKTDADELMFLRDQAGHKNPESRASIQPTGHITVVAKLI